MATKRITMSEKAVDDCLAQILASGKILSPPKPLTVEDTIALLLKDEHIVEKHGAYVLHDRYVKDDYEADLATEPEPAAEIIALPEASSANQDQDEEKGEGSDDYDLEDLRSVLVRTIQGIESGSVPVDKAKAINETARNLIDTGKLQIAHALAEKQTGKQIGNGRAMKLVSSAKNG